jgi:RNA recognition motif-containing protein
MRLQPFRGNVFVANLPPDLTEDELAEAFDPFGIVLSAFIARDPESGKRLRYGFVDIATERAAKLAVEAMNGTAIGGHNLDVRISERPNKAKRSAPGRPSAHRPPLRSAPQHNVEPDGSGASAPPAAARRQPTFKVERRPLPRLSIRKS